MNRTLRVARIFSLGQYQNITLEDTIDAIPQELASNVEFISNLSYLQLLNVERRINLYYKLREEHREQTPAEAIALIEAEIASTNQILYAEIQKVKG